MLAHVLNEDSHGYVASMRVIICSVINARPANYDYDIANSLSSVHHMPPLIGMAGD